MTNLIDHATSDILNLVDWSANLQLVDQINTTADADMYGFRPTHQTLCGRICHNIHDDNRTATLRRLRVVVRHLRKRLQIKAPRVVKLALTLTDTLVTNCHSGLHEEIATEKFLDTLSRIAKVLFCQSLSLRASQSTELCLIVQENVRRSDSDSCEILDKVLELLQSWDEAFRPQHAALPLFHDTYRRLRLDGLPFPNSHTQVGHVRAIALRW